MTGQAEGTAGRVAGKVVLITGAGHGQGRNHAVRLAEQGADIIAVDICEQIGTIPYPLASADELKETARLVERTGRRIIAVQADVRERSQLAGAVEGGIAEFGRLDVVVANAGVAPMGVGLPKTAFMDTVDINLVGVINTLAVTLPHLSAGASVIAVGSIASLLTGTTETAGPGGMGYSHSKQVVAKLVHDVALVYAPDLIRVNAVHPTNVNTVLMHNENMYRQFRPDLEDPTREDAELAFRVMQPMPIPYIEVDDVSHAVVYLASDESRYVTGLQFKVDAGAMLKNTATTAPQ